MNIGKKEFVATADAMPEDKYSFAPTAGEFKGVRTFAEQVKHVAAVNYIFGAAILRENRRWTPVKRGARTRSRAKLKSCKFLKDSFAYLHKALASITEKNAIRSDNSCLRMKAARLSVGAFAALIPLDHYGQMVEYLRMNGIVPPASRPQQISKRATELHDLHGSSQFH